MTMYVQIDNDEVVINEEKLGDVVVWAKSLNETKDMLTLLRRHQAYYLRIPNEKNEYFKNFNIHPSNTDGYLEGKLEQDEAQKLIDIGISIDETPSN